MHPTPTAVPYGSGQNGSHGKGGKFERPSGNTPSLWSKATSWGGELVPRFTEWTMGFRPNWSLPTAAHLASWIASVRNESQR